MSHRLLPLTLVVLALACVVALPTFAVDKDKDNSHEGTIVKAGDGKLTMTMKGEKVPHDHDVAKDAKITLDGKPAKLEDLKEGMAVKVTTDDKNVATMIEAKSVKDKDK
jgi:hypothetical protein